MPPGMPGHCPGIGLPYDPAEARILLAEAGYPGGRNFPEVEALTWQDHMSTVRIEYLQKQWCENLGVGISWKQKELVNLSKERFQVFISGWIADYPDPDNFMRGGGWRVETRWRNVEFEELVEEARRVMDQVERRLR